jgi:F-type H+-transporting ATPase subunit b
MILSMSEVLENVSEFVDKCLGPLGSSGFDWYVLRDIIIQLCATLILFIVIRVFIWKRVTNILEARRASIDKELVEAKEANRKARLLAAKNEEKLEAAEQEIKAMLDKADKDANLRREEIIQNAKDEAHRRLSNVEDDIQQEILEKNAEIHQQIVDIAMLAAEKIVEHEVDQDKYIDLVNKIIEEASSK